MNRLCDFIFKCSLSQFADSPTHIRGNILGLVLSNTPDHIRDISVDPDSSSIISSGHLSFLLIQCVSGLSFQKSTSVYL